MQDGHKLATLPIEAPLPSEPFRIVGVWWFKEEIKKPTLDGNIPDIFKREGTIVRTHVYALPLHFLNSLQTGTAHSILKILPLLDSLREESQKMTFVND